MVEVSRLIVPGSYTHQYGDAQQGTAIPDLGIYVHSGWGNRCILRVGK